MAGNNSSWQASLGAQISPAGIRKIEDQIQAISKKYKLNLDVNINDQQVKQVAKQVEQATQKIKTKVKMRDSMFINDTVEKQAFDKISGRIKEVRKNIDSLGKVSVKKNEVTKQLESATLTYYNKELGHTVTETMGWVTAQKKVNGEMVKLKEFRTKSTVQTDDAAARTKAFDAKKLETLEIQKQIALYKEQLAIRIKDKQTTYGANWKSGQSDAILNKSSQITQKNYKDAIRQTNLEMNKQISISKNLQKQTQLTSKATDSFATTLVKDASKMIAWTMVGAVIFGALKELKEGIQLIKDLDKAMTNIQMVMGYTREEVKGMVTEYSALASTLHETTLSVMKASEEFLRAGRTQAETLKLIEASTLMSKISGQEQKETADQLIAITNGFKLSAEETMQVVDKLTTVDNKSATSTKELGEALERTAVSAQLGGSSFERLVSYIATVSSISRKSASSIGESFKTIYARFSDVKGGKLFDEFNDSISNVERDLQHYAQITLRSTSGEFKDFDVVIDELAKKWNTLNEVQQAAIVKALAGVRQRENLLILMENYSTALKLEEEQLNSTGSAMKRYDEYSKSIEAHTNDFDNALQNVWRTLIESDFIKFFVDAGTAYLKFATIMSQYNPTGILFPFKVASEVFAQIGTNIDTIKDKLEEPLRKAGILSVLDSFKDKGETTLDRFLVKLKRINEERLNDKGLLGVLFRLNFANQAIKAALNDYKSIDNSGQIEDYESSLLSNRRKPKATPVSNYVPEDYQEIIKDNLSLVNDLQSAYEKLAKGEKLSSDEILKLTQQYPELNSYIAETGDLYFNNGKVIEDAISNQKNKFTEFLQSIIDNKNATDDMKMAAQSMMSVLNGIGDKPRETFEEINEEINNLISSLGDLNSAYETLSDGQALSTETLVELIQKYPLIADYISKTGDLTLKHGAILQTLSKQYVSSAIAQLKAEKSKQVGILASYQAQINALRKLIAYQDISAKAASMANLAAAMARTSSTIRQIDAQINALGKVSFGSPSSSGSGASSKMSKALQSINKQIDARISALDKAIDQEQDELDIIKERHAEEEKINNLLKAREELSNVQNEKNTRMLIGDRWEYVADPRALRDAQERVDELELQKKQDDEIAAQQAVIDNLESQKQILTNFKSAVDKLSDSVSRQIKSWSGLIAALKKAKLLPADVPHFDTGGMPSNDGMAHVLSKERILDPNQTKDFNTLVKGLTASNSPISNLLSMMKMPNFSPINKTSNVSSGTSFSIQNMTVVANNPSDFMQQMNNWAAVSPRTPR
jgi:TP901 family phage tail tape measure protein